MGETGFRDDPDRHMAILVEGKAPSGIGAEILRLKGNGSIVLQPFASATLA